MVDEILSAVDVRNTAEVYALCQGAAARCPLRVSRVVVERRLKFHLEPALRFPLLHELLLLYQSLFDYDKVERLLPLLDDAVRWAGDPVEAEAAAQRLRAWRGQGFTVTGGTSFDAHLHSVRALIQQGQLEAAQAALAELQNETGPPRLAAQYLLVAGELATALALRHPEAAGYWADQAVDHLTSTARLAHQLSLPQIYAQALHLLGTVYSNLSHDIPSASEYWARADGAEELIARRQETDEARVRYLEAVPTQHDEQIEAAATKALAHEGAGLAAVLAAIEAARGAAILAHVLPAEASRLRELPSPNDPPACWRWCTAIATRLPRNLVVWMLHPTPNRLHHVLLGAGTAALGFRRRGSKRFGGGARFGGPVCLLENVEPGRAGCVLEGQVRTTPDFIPNQYRRIAQMLRLDLVLPALPRHVTRLAMVPGYAMGEIPFAALPLPGATGPETLLIQRYALSLLPCLSARQP